MRYTGFSLSHSKDRSANSSWCFPRSQFIQWNIFAKYFSKHIKIIVTIVCLELDNIYMYDNESLDDFIIYFGHFVIAFI